MKKNLNLTQQKHAFTNQKKCITTQTEHKTLKPGLVAIHSTKIKNQIKGALHPRAHMGPNTTEKMHKKTSTLADSERQDETRR